MYDVKKKYPWENLKINVFGGIAYNFFPQENSIADVWQGPKYRDVFRTWPNT